jgi:hypothetical protein
VTGAFVFCPEATGDDIINLVDVFSAQVFRLSGVGRNRASRKLTGLDSSPNQAVDTLGGFSIDEEGGIFLIFLIHSAALCSASSSCSMVMDWLRWFLA